TREIFIRVSGTDKFTLFDYIREKFTQIHNTFHRLQVSEMIPCVCESCVQDNTQMHFFEYSQLHYFLRQNTYVAQCAISGINVEIQNILNGISAGVRASKLDMRYDYDVFISHSSIDKDIVRQIATDL